jgi:RNA polymerase sigma factor (sigma-70 family)
MAATLTDWLRNLRGRLPASGTVPDAELLRQFAATRDEEAFSALVARHGPMVFGVCRRLLGHSPDAEDAFQAAFVVLAVKAEAVVRLGKVGAWLHGVAFHVARKARDRSTRGRILSLDAVPPGEACPTARPETPSDPDAEHTREKLDEVLAGLPSKYRACVVLCDLEGLSRKDASERLGWTEGTLSGRLARARKLLADRLARRGVTVGSAGLGAVLSAQPLAAAVPSGLAASTLATVALVGGGLGTLPPGLAALTQGVTRAMFPNRSKLLAAGLVGAGLLVTGVGTLLIAAPADPQPPRRPLPANAAPPANAQNPAPMWKEKATLVHEAGITALALGPNEIYGGDTVGKIVTWDARTGKEKEKTLNGLGVQIDWLGLDPDANLLYIVTLNRGAINALNLKKLTGPGFGLDGSKFLSFSPDTKYYLHTGPGDPKRVAVMPNQLSESLIGGLVEADLKHDAEVLHAVVTDDNTIAVTTTDDGGVHAWNLATKKKLWDAKPDELQPTALAVSPGGKRVAVAGKDGSVRLLDGKSGKETATLAGHTGAVNAIAFNGEDGRKLVTAGEDKTVRVWETATGRSAAVLRGHTDSVKAVVITADGSAVVSGSADKSVKVWEPKK